LTSIFRRLFSFFFPDRIAGPAGLSGYIDSLIQTFENCRPGLSDEIIGAGEQEAEHFFADLYEKELPRLKSMIRVQEGYLSQDARERFLDEVCALIQKVVVPAYVRLAVRFTPRERNDFYLLPEQLHFVERIAAGVAGMALGGFVVWAPFIPLWSKEWVLPFLIAGLIFPNLRRLVSLKSYEAELNRLVAKADREIDRIEMAYITSEQSLQEPTSKEDSSGQQQQEEQAFRELDDRDSSTEANKREARRKIKH